MGGQKACQKTFWGGGVRKVFSIQFPREGTEFPRGGKAMPALNEALLIYSLHLCLLLADTKALLNMKTLADVMTPIPDVPQRNIIVDVTPIDQVQGSSSSSSSSSSSALDPDPIPDHGVPIPGTREA